MIKVYGHISNYNQDLAFLSRLKYKVLRGEHTDLQNCEFGPCNQIQCKTIRFLLLIFKMVRVEPNLYKTDSKIEFIFLMCGLPGLDHLRVVLALVILIVVHNDQISSFQTCVGIDFVRHNSPATETHIDCFVLLFVIRYMIENKFTNP